MGNCENCVYNKLWQMVERPLKRETKKNNKLKKQTWKENE